MVMNKKYILLLISIFMIIIFWTFSPVLRNYGIVLFIFFIVHITTEKEKESNRRKFNEKMKGLKIKNNKLEMLYQKLYEEESRIKKEIDRFSNLYELSKDIEKSISSFEVAKRALSSLNFKMQLDRGAFYEKTGESYKLIERMNINEATAQKWLKKSELNSGFFKFYLGKKERELGIIICEGQLNDKQLKETEILINQISLGYERSLMYEEVKKLSRIDGLTGLYLRGYFLERFLEEINRAKREKYKIVFLMMDIDNFKKYNDTYGHPMGDNLLKNVSTIIKESIYSSDFAGRYGGEEFCVFMPMAEAEGGLTKAEKIRKKIEENTPTTISIGISYFPEKTDAEELIKSADAALYQAKESGKNKICQS